MTQQVAEAAMIRLSEIHIRQGLSSRPVDEAIVRSIADSIIENGMANPITVRRTEAYVFGALSPVVELVAGRHRLEASKKLGLVEIECRFVDLDDDGAELLTIDENLCRAELSPSDRARFTARRKALYEKAHPETKHGAVGGGHDQSRQLGDSADRFTADTSAKTGKPERSIQRDAERGEKVEPSALEVLAGTKLDTGAYLDKLKAVPRVEQVNRVRADLAASPPPPPADEERKAAQRQRYYDVLASLDDDVRTQVLAEAVATYLANRT